MSNKKIILISLWLGVLTLLFVYSLLKGEHGTLIQSLQQPVRRHLVSAERPQRRPIWHHPVDSGIHINADRGELLDFDTADRFRSLVLQSLNNSRGKRRHSLRQVILLSSLLPPLTNITRMPTPSKEVFLNYIAPTGLPVIFTDMLSGTRLDNWSWEQIKQRWGHHVFRNTRQGNYSNKVDKFGKHRINRVSVRLSHFVDLVTGVRRPEEHEKGLYITKQKILPPEALENEFYYPPFYPGNHRNCFLEPTGWIGAAGTFTQGHIDSKDNFVYQLIGQKQWTIYPPIDYYNLYYKKEKGSLEWSRALNAREGPDMNQYPLYKKTHPISFTMSPGEVLYLPRGWTHFVVNLSPALMLNTWRRGPAGITESWIEKNRQEIRELCY